MHMMGNFTVVTNEWRTIEFQISFKVCYLSLFSASTFIYGSLYVVEKEKWIGRSSEDHTALRT